MACSVQSSYEKEICTFLQELDTCIRKEPYLKGPERDNPLLNAAQLLNERSVWASPQTASDALMAYQIYVWKKLGEQNCPTQTIRTSSIYKLLSQQYFAMQKRLASSPQLPKSESEVLRSPWFQRFLEAENSLSSPFSPGRKTSCHEITMPKATLLSQKNQDLAECICNPELWPAQSAMHENYSQIFEFVFIGNASTFESLYAPSVPFRNEMRNCEDLHISPTPTYVISLVEKKDFHLTIYPRSPDTTLPFGVQHFLRHPVCEGPEGWIPLREKFDEMFSMIDRAREEETSLLVYCGSGQCRSVAVVIAYLMNRCRVSYAQAQAFIQNQRAGIFSLEEFSMYSFGASLEAYERELGITSTSP